MSRTHKCRHFAEADQMMKARYVYGELEMSLDRTEDEVETQNA
jgi:hypothetical protein